MEDETARCGAISKSEAAVEMGNLSCPVGVKNVWTDKFIVDENLGNILYIKVYNNKKGAGL